MKKKIFLAIAMISLILAGAKNHVFAYETVYETESVEKITSGVTLKNDQRFGDKGWLNMNIVEVDLKDKNTQIGLLNSENGLNTFQTVLQMSKAADGNVVAAVNGDFFNGNYQNGNTIGLSISNGEMYTSTYWENANKDTFGTFALDEKKNGLFGYFSNEITLKRKGSEIALPIAEINKVSSDYSYPVLYTSTWGDKSIGMRYGGGLTELLVKNNKVVEVRTNGEAFDIPENGFVVSAYGAAADYLIQNFKPKNKVELDINLNLDYEKIDMAISGGAMLVENGRVPETFASNITGANPRTAIGLSKDGKTLYLVTVDGRQASSVGLTQTEFAEILIEKGCYQALNLDGGGSTTMVARTLGEDELKTVNSPSGGTLRMVTNSVGVFNTSKTGSLAGLVLKPSHETIFANETYEIEVLGYDKYENPVSVNKNKIKWSSSDASGEITVTAQVGKVKESVVLHVLDVPNEIEISPKAVGIKLGESVSFSIIGKDVNGETAPLSAENVTFELVSGKGTFKQNQFTPQSAGEHIIAVSVGDVKSYAKVAVAEKSITILDNFEEESFHFVSYPEVVEGDASLSKKEKYEGRSSAQITYDFTSTDATRAAYLRFENDGIQLPEGAEILGFMVYSKEAKEDDIKLKIVDAKGNSNLVMAKAEIPGGEWTKVTVALNKIALPAKLTDIYVVQDHAEIKNTGKVYFDQLYIESSGSVKALANEIPADVKGVDKDQKESELSSEEALKILVYDEKENPDTLLDVYTARKVKSKAMVEADMMISTAQLKNRQYQKEEIENACIISLDVSNGGLRATNFKQWISLQEDIHHTNQKNILVVMNGSLESFSDAQERQLLIDVLSKLKEDTHKSIWVISKGEKTTYSMEKGIKLLTINNQGIAFDEVGKNQKYIMITATDEAMTYEIKRVFE